MKRLISASIFGLALGAMTFGGSVAAQDATPIAPAPELCTLTPPTFEELSAYAASPVAEVTAEAEATPGAELTLPEGTPVDDATRDAVEQSMIINVACLNTGSTLLTMAAYSQSALERLIGGSGPLSQELYDSLATPEAIAVDDFTVIYEFQDMVMLDDGRVAAIIVGDNQADDTTPAGPTLFYLAEKDGHWYIDDFINPAE
ncbi:MAG: hypothetical protein R2848_17150 [Thermomicrobiales bacterium]